MAGREVLDDELFGPPYTPPDSPPGQHAGGAGREVDDDELFGTSPAHTAHTANIGVGREVDDDELFGNAGGSSSAPRRAIAPRARLQPLMHRPNAVLPVKSARKRARAPAVSSPTTPRARPLAVTSPTPIRRPSRPTPARPLGGGYGQTELDVSYLSNRAELSSAGVVCTRRTLAEYDAHYDGLPWHIGRDESSRALLKGRPRLSEIALSLLSARTRAGNSTKDMHLLPADFAHAVLTGVEPDKLERIEERVPALVPEIEARWARIVFEEHGVDELPDHSPSWRAYHEEMRMQRAVQLSVAANNLRQGYASGGPTRRTQMINEVPRAGRKRARVQNGPISAIARMRLNDGERRRRLKGARRR